MQNLTILSSKL